MKKLRSLFIFTSTEDARWKMLLFSIILLVGPLYILYKEGDVSDLCVPLVMSYSLVLVVTLLFVNKDYVIKEHVHGNLMWKFLLILGFLGLLINLAIYAVLILDAPCCHMVQ